MAADISRVEAKRGGVELGVSEAVAVRLKATAPPLPPLRLAAAAPRQFNMEGKVHSCRPVHCRTLQTFATSTRAAAAACVSDRVIIIIGNDDDAAPHTGAKRGPGGSINFDSFFFVADWIIDAW